MSRSSLPSFIRIWQSSATLQDVADKVGTAKQAASQIASRLRASGVPLKKFSRGWEMHEHSKKTKRYADDTLKALIAVAEEEPNAPST